MAASPETNHQVGILSFEMASAMSRIIHLHRSLSPPEISRLHSQILPSHGIQTLISADQSHLLELVSAEKSADLDRSAGAVSRLGRRCRDPVLAGFEHVYADLRAGRSEPGKLLLPPRDLEAAIKKMERLVGATAALHAELETLTELETGSKRSQLKLAFDNKIKQQRREVLQLRSLSLWNQTFDGAVGLMASTVCAVHLRLAAVFGGVGVPVCELGRRVPCGPSPVRLLAHCLNLTSSATVEEVLPRRIGLVIGLDQTTSNLWAGTGTVGGAALALHYANVIVIVEKFLRYPHLVGEEARDDLYQMLPTSLRSSLRRKLKDYVKEMAIYDAPVAHDWRERLGKVLAWLGPMAHGMIRWQAERSFEQQQIGPRGSVLLVETIFFADREKFEEVLCEILVGLNYICRYEHQQSALLDCSSSHGFEDCLDWDSPL